MYSVQQMTTLEFPAVYIKRTYNRKYILIKSSNTEVTYVAGVCNIQPFTCCANYKRNGSQCEECSPGTFGINCKISCPDGFYGRYCKERCNCSLCNKISGYCQNSSTWDVSNPMTVNKKGIIWWIIMVAASLVVGIPFGTIICKKCSRENQPTVYFYSTNTHNRNASAQMTTTHCRNTKKETKWL
ncbi:uncharacterized protein LOC134244229 [Saccostrea cucullata]|uniref:uncharacterized protein LOC134244229 n=1 Tax=Saccostrea cuccullata TaxID=36930 RepID=UPI002ED14A6D